MYYITENQFNQIKNSIKGLAGSRVLISEIEKQIPDDSKTITPFSKCRSCINAECKVIPVGKCKYIPRYVPADEVVNKDFESMCDKIEAESDC